jgi:hypothetical protein
MNSTGPKENLVKLIICLVVACLTGCATAPSPRLERAWHVSNTLDYAQTVNIAKRPDCFREVDPVTSAVFGEQPSKRTVAVEYIVTTAAHRMIADWLTRKAENSDSTAWYRAANAWHWGTLAYSVRTVARNHSIGMRPFGNGCYKE